jgi:hypothetical protein
MTYPCTCHVELPESDLTDEIVHVYYMLDNFYQNSRRYVKSIDHYQLLGRRVDEDDPLSADCDPYSHYEDENGVKHKYAPCGAIANSFFNGLNFLISKNYL